MASGVTKTARRLRHMIVGLAVAFIAVYFAAPDFKISLARLGLEQEITALQLSALAPVLIAYLVVHTCIVSCNRIRLTHECMLIAHELRRFGCHTNYCVTKRYQQFCKERRKGGIRQLLAAKSFTAVYLSRDIFLGFSLLLAVIASLAMGGKVYAPLYPVHPHVAVLFYVYLGISIFTAAFAVAAYWFARRAKDDLLREYLQEDWVEPTDMLEQQK